MSRAGSRIALRRHPNSRQPRQPAQVVGAGTVPEPAASFGGTVHRAAPQCSSGKVETSL
jgi:hypothetical protein